MLIEFQMVSGVAITLFRYGQKMIRTACAMISTSLAAKLYDTEQDKWPLYLVYTVKAQIRSCMPTVKPQWLEHFRNHGNLFETWVVRDTEGHSARSGGKWR